MFVKYHRYIFVQRCVMFDKLRFNFVFLDRCFFCATSNQVYILVPDANGYYHTSPVVVVTSVTVICAAHRDRNFFHFFIGAGRLLHRPK